MMNELHLPNHVSEIKNCQKMFQFHPVRPFSAIPELAIQSFSIQVIPSHVMLIHSDCLEVIMHYLTALTFRSGLCSVFQQQEALSGRSQHKIGRILRPDVASLNAKRSKLYMAMIQFVSPIWKFQFVLNINFLEDIQKHAKRRTPSVNPNILNVFLPWVFTRSKLGCL